MEAVSPFLMYLRGSWFARGVGGGPTEAARGGGGEDTGLLVTRVREASADHNVQHWKRLEALLVSLCVVFFCSVYIPGWPEVKDDKGKSIWGIWRDTVSR